MEDKIHTRVKGELQGSNIKYVHSTTNNFSINAAESSSRKAYQQGVDSLSKFIKQVSKKKEKLNKSIKRKRGEYLDFVDILNEVAQEDGDEGMKIITEFNLATVQIQQAFNKENKTWERKDVGDKKVFYYKNTTGKKQYQVVKYAFENFAKLLAYFKRREGWFENDSAELQKYMPKETDGTIVQKYDTARKMFEQIAVAVKKLNTLVGTDVDKLFTYKEDSDGNIEFISTNAFLNFIEEWQQSQIKSWWIGYEAEPLVSKMIEIVNERLTAEIEAKGIGIFNDKDNKSRQALGDIAVIVANEIYYGSIKTNISSSRKRAALDDKGKYSSPKEKNDAVPVSVNEGYWLGTLYANAFTPLADSHGGLADADLAKQSYYNLLLAYAIRATTGRLAQEAGDICFLVVNDRAIWYDDFLKIYWDSLLRDQTTIEQKQDLVTFYLNKEKVFGSFKQKNNINLYYKKLKFAVNLRIHEAVDNSNWYKERINEKIKDDDTLKTLNQKNFMVQFAAVHPVEWAKVKGLKHCLLATPNKV